MERSAEMKKEFDTLYEKWVKFIRDSKIQYSSRTRDYVNNEPYREIVKLGRDALPLILEKIEQGEFFMNQAALEITGINLERIIEEENQTRSEADKLPEFLSEQEKSEVILRYIRGK